MADEANAATTENQTTDAAQTTTATTEAGATKAEATTVLTDGGAKTEATAAATWPDDWRDRASKGDEKRLAKLQRYTSPEAALDALFAAQQKLSSGELKSAKPKADTPEAIAEWRKENGIPEKPEEYDLTLPDGLVVGEQDKPLIGEFVKDMHGANAHPDVVKKAVASYYKLQEQALQARYEADVDIKVATEDELRAEWGSDYRRNVSSINGLLDSAPEGIKDKIMTARFADGTPLASDANALRWLANLSREINPVATVVPGAGANAGEAIATEISTLTKMMGDRTSDYWKGPNAEKNQARYRELVAAKAKMK